jgi:hypothetical protein
VACILSFSGLCLRKERAVKKVIALLLGLGLVVGTVGCENKPKPTTAGGGGGAGGGGATATPAAGGSPTAPK